jgi:hypothetical protein
MTLIADRPLTAPVAVTISPHLLGHKFGSYRWKSHRPAILLDGRRAA